MTGAALLRVYETLKELGFLRSGRTFSQHWLGRHKHFVRDVEHRPGRQSSYVSQAVVSRLIQNLDALRPHLSPGLASNISKVLDEIARDIQVSSILARSDLHYFSTNDGQGSMS